MKVSLPPMESPALNVSALIDMVFLLLIYFMVSASLIKSEGDLGIRLPGVVQQMTAVDMPDEQIIEIHETGDVLLNGRKFGAFDSQELPVLVQTLTRYKIASLASKNKALITVWAADDSKHQRIIDVLNACAAAGIENITFAAASE